MTPAPGFEAITGPSLAGMPGLAEVQARLARRAAAAGCDLVLLVPYRAPPPVTARRDAAVDSALVSRRLTVALGDRGRGGDAEAAVYKLLAAVAGAPRPRLLVEQVGGPEMAAPAAVPAIPDDVAGVVAYRGPLALLAASLGSLPPGLPVFVGFDGVPEDGWRAWLPPAADRTYFRAGDGGSGPFAVREAMISESGADRILFQDGDDIATVDRLAGLDAAMNGHAADLVGSHALVLDHLASRVIPERFPLDVDAALRRAPAHPQLQPTTLIRRRALDTSGGFSTDITFAADSQFLLRAAFSLRIRNVDRFLYVHRHHAGALTHAIDLRADARLDLDLAWKDAYLRVRRGEIALDASDLARTSRAVPLAVERLG